MNATEKLVELYYREKGCFTISDVKVLKGNNRQFDLLAIERNEEEEINYHIEVQVTHGLKWGGNNINFVKERLEKKFFGLPSDSAKRRTSHLEEIKSTYRSKNFNYDKVVRVWCSWNFQNTDAEIDKVLTDLSTKYKIKRDLMVVLNFRDEVLKYLIENVGTANYDDEILRTLSLIKQMNDQVGN